MAIDDVLGYAGRRVVVTGAASGMGEATARLLVELDAEVVALDVKPTSLEGATGMQVDLRDRASIEETAAALDGPVHAFFNCAGLPGPPFADLDVMLVNFVGARHLIDSVVPKMPSGSAIAYVASAGGLGWQQQLGTLMELIQTDGFDAAKAWCEAHPELITGSGSYLFSKQVINAWTTWRAFELLDKHGIRLNCTNPGPTSTGMMPYFHEAVGQSMVDAAQGPVGRYSTAEEQAWPLIFLNSPRCSYVSGETFFTDGGFYAALQNGQLDFSKLMGS
ncbi:MAG TPA: coniferyl-alcohol dehydrogenase [Acidimicrobiales bacterium]|nr:coniferyl-alcohol dehydrogenase [Acidimicrobiales bacterium]